MPFRVIFRRRYSHQNRTCWAPNLPSSSPFLCYTSNFSQFRCLTKFQVSEEQLEHPISEVSGLKHIAYDQIWEPEPRIDELQHERFVQLQQEGQKWKSQEGTLQLDLGALQISSKCKGTRATNCNKGRPSATNCAKFLKSENVELIFHGKSEASFRLEAVKNCKLKSKTGFLFILMC
jgi:hypothetical protein